MNLFKPNVQRMKEKKNVPGLIRALRNKDFSIRLDACWALGRIKDKRATEALFTALKDKDELVRLNVAETLASCGDPRVADSLMELLSLDLINSVRYRAVMALYELHDPRAVGVLRKACVPLLQDPDYIVREESAKILSEIGVPEDPVERAWYAAAHRDWEDAIKLGQISVGPLFLATKTRWVDVQVDAAIALAELNDSRAVGLLITALPVADKHPIIYPKAAKALGRYGDRRAIKPLQDCIQNYESDAQAVAYKALSDLAERLNKISTPTSPPTNIVVPPLSELDKEKKRISTKQPVCSNCGEIIPAIKHTIADDIRAGGGIVIGGNGLDQTLYNGLICRACGRLYCNKCHNTNEKGYNCPECNQHLSPLFADYLTG